MIHIVYIQSLHSHFLCLISHLTHRFSDIKLPNILGDQTIKKIAEKHERSPAQIILRYFVQKNIVMIPKSVSPSRLKENFDLFNFSLDKTDIAALKALDKGEAGRLLDPAKMNPK